MMKEIIKNEGAEDEEGSSIIVLPELLSVKLEDMPELSRFCHRNHSLEFPSLETMTIAGCPKLKSFVLSKVNQEETLGTIIQPLFTEKVAFPKLKVLNLSDMHSLAEIWQNQLPEHSFVKLLVLEVSNCNQLLNIGPANMLSKLQRLKVLDIRGCNSLEEIFVTQGAVPNQNAAASAAVSLPSLSELKLHNLPKLRNIWWNRDLQEIGRFQSLCLIDVSRCDSLNYVISPSVAKGLVQLQKLRVDSCQLMKEIVGKSGNVEPVDMILLPRLHNLQLENLPNVISFCTRTCALKWPSLRELRILNCSKISMFLSIPRERVDESKGALGGSLYNSNKPFFSDKVVFPNLEKLRIDSLGSLQELWHKGLAAESFCQLRLLEVKNCDCLLKIAPFSLLTRLQNLEELSITQCDSLEKIIEQGQDSDDIAMFPLLHTLQLINLPKLGSFCSGNHSLECPKLQNMNMEDCPSMQTSASGLLVTPKLVQ